MDSGYAEAVVSEKHLGKENGPLAYASGPKIGWAWIRPLMVWSAYAAFRFTAEVLPVRRSVCSS